VVIPVFNESETLHRLYQEIKKSVSSVDINSYEVIFVDDGSSDNSWEIISQIYEQNSDIVNAVRLRKNFGKAAALDCGFKESTGDVVITMDSDLQDDPLELKKFIEKINDGYDVVSGWKEKRNDPTSKTLPSKLFNHVTALATGIKLHDFNCGYKAYRKEILKNVQLYGELHRYIPVLAHDAGFKIGEVSINHRPREHGVSKYGWERYARGLLDLLTVVATTRYFQKPGHLFGSAGLVSGLIGFSILMYLGFIWSIGMGPIGNRPLLAFGILMTILSIQLISLGILAELITRHLRTNQSSNIIKTKKQNTRSKKN